MPSAADTPMMRQYLELKARVPDALLLYRMGDFYELFFDDAREAAELLDLTLTSRNKGAPDEIPMAGVPHHALENYLRRLVEAGRKVAIAEQVERPGQRLMDRQLVRVVTPGVPWDPAMVEARESCWLAAVAGAGPVGVAMLDASTGRLRLGDLPDAEAAAMELQRAEVREVLLDPAAEGLPELARALGGAARSAADPAWFDRAAAREALRDLLGVADLSGFGAEGLGPALAAAGAVVAYARDRALVDLSHVRRLETFSASEHMELDEATLRNLEVLRPLRGSGRKGTLLGLLDRTRTAMGGRLLREWLAAPLLDRAAIEERLDAVDALLEPELRRAVRERLALVADLERLSTKASQGTADARDLVALAGSLEVLPGLAERLRGIPALEGRLPEDLAGDVAADVRHWLVDQPPASLTEGGLVRAGVHEELDHLVALSREGKGAIARIEARERERTGIASLKVKHNKVFGYFFEVTTPNLDRVPPDWFRKQTLSSCERFVSEELKRFEQEVLGAEERRRNLEYALFRELRERVGRQAGRLQAIAEAVAWLDVVSTFAEVAVDRRYRRPRVVEEPVLDLCAARHPVVEAMELDERFVPNDIRIDEDRRLVVLTGPNMAGKSTIMRQVALVALMAQVGSFVPADEATVGLCDRIFVRVGASDDLARGRSTFMVEMSETALILNQATERSLVLLDEIGRGTSTYDGLAIAWAVAEEVHDRLRCRAIFATHYHELVALADDKPHVANLHVAVSEAGERIVFLRRLRPGGASKSYGIQCARLAGMPRGVVERARALLAEFERHPHHGGPSPQLSLFAAPPPPEPPPRRPDPLREALADVDPDELTPRAALDLVYRLKALAEEEAG